VTAGQVVQALCVRVQAQMEAFDTEGYHTTHPDFVGHVYDACCAAYVYGGVYLHANVHRPYLFAFATLLQMGAVHTRELSISDLSVREGAERWEVKHGVRLRIKKAKEE
jgi:hypothetical protein